jgi:hypothetical protein
VRQSLKEVAQVLLGGVELPVVAAGVVVLTVDPVRVKLPPVGGEHLGRWRRGIMIREVGLKI